MALRVAARRGQRLRGLLVIGAALALLPLPAFAQQDPSSSSSSQSTASAPTRDFMIGRPRASVGVRGSFILASAGSDFYETVTEELTLEKKDFNSGSFGVELNVNVHPRLDISGGVDWNNISQPSEDSEMEELLPNGTRIPIQQVTELSQMNLTASVKFALVPRGRQISRLAWIPATFIPYVGGGGGYGKYTLRQNGDFVDFVDNHIFTDTFRSEGWAPSAHVLGGTDILLYKRLMLSLEGRYSWSNADLDSDFVAFDPIDLGGFRFGAGIQFIF